MQGGHRAIGFSREWPPFVRLWRRSSIGWNPNMPATRDVRWIPHSLLLAGMAACIAATGCHKNTPTTVATEAQPVAAKEVAVVEARLEPWPQTIRVQGSLLAYEDAVVGSKLAGRVATVNVDLGSIVKRGEPLVTLGARRARSARPAGRSAAAASLRRDRHHARRRRKPVRCPERRPA